MVIMEEIMWIYKGLINEGNVWILSGFARVVAQGLQELYLRVCRSGPETDN
jgi:hypothetical protein